MRHGLLSSSLVLDDECSADFAALIADLCKSLNPVGALEVALVERIGIGMWRQRRLVAAEAAQTALRRQPKKIVQGISSELGSSFGSDVTPEDLAPLDADSETSCRSVVTEIEQFTGDTLTDLQSVAPLTHAQLVSDAGADGEDAEQFIRSHDGGLINYLAELLIWCREQIRAAEERPHVLEIADLVRARRLILPDKDVELFSRYQTTLDNQLYKALRALREAQEWRCRTLELNPPPTPPNHSGFCT